MIFVCLSVLSVIRVLARLKDEGAMRAAMLFGLARKRQRGSAGSDAGIKC